MTNAEYAPRNTKHETRTTMNEPPDFLGRTLRSSTAAFTFGATENTPALPAFGELVRAEAGGAVIFGLVYEVLIQDDPFVRQIVAASAELQPERIEDMRQRRQVPVEISALAIACQQGGATYQRIPPRPPGALQPIYACNDSERCSVLGEPFSYFHTVLNSAQCPAEELLAASLRRAAESQLPGQGGAFLLRAGRELARLLAADLPRLDAILRRLA